jgi:chitinase
LHVGVTSTTLNGYSQPASSTPPAGTFQSGVFDYYDLVNNYLPTYTRYWDNASKVPFLFNIPEGIWISYDDLQSISGKSAYIIQQQLGGAMFWELSGDPSGDLVGATFTALTNGQTTASTSSTAQTTTSSKTTTASTTKASTSTTSRSTSKASTSTGSTTTTKASTSTASRSTSKASTSTASKSTTQSTSGNIPAWAPYTSYSVGSKVTYGGNTYQCIQAHTSLPNWEPPNVPALWQLL